MTCSVGLYSYTLSCLRMPLDMCPHATLYVSLSYPATYVSTTYDVHLSSYCCAVLLSSIRILLRACIIRCAVIAFENGHIQQRAGEEVAAVRRLRAQARQANGRQATHPRAFRWTTRAFRWTITNTIFLLAYISYRAREVSGRRVFLLASFPCTAGGGGAVCRKHRYADLC